LNQIICHLQLKEGAIKAWHGHLYQSQWNYVVYGRINVALYDNRIVSSSYKKNVEFLAGDEENSIANIYSLKRDAALEVFFSLENGIQNTIKYYN